MTQLTMNISGMTCGHCVGSVTRALKELDGVAVERVAVGTAKVAYDGDKTTPADIAQAIENEGYRVTSAA
jgi:copper chaperone